MVHQGQWSMKGVVQLRNIRGQQEGNKTTVLTSHKVIAKSKRIGKILRR